MEAKRKRTDPTPPSPPPAAAAASAIASVFGSDDLLRSILLRLNSPTCLVRAAAVSQRWLRHASDSALLHHFGARHPPRPLGFYLRLCSGPAMNFVPMPGLLEDLAASVRLASSKPGDRVVEFVEDCRSGRLIFWVPCPCPLRMYRPLHPARGIVAYPQPPVGTDNSGFFHSRHFLPRDDGGDGMSCIAVTLRHNDLRAWVHLQTAADGETWGEAVRSETIELPQRLMPNIMFLRRKFSLLANGKIYMHAMPWYILGLDLASTSLFCIKLPEGVKSRCDGDLALSRAEDSGFYIVHLRNARMYVWHHNMDTSNWKIIDTVCLRQAFSPRHVENGTWGVDVVYVAAVGDNAKFVFLLINCEIFYMHISSRTLKKVCDIPMPHGLLRALYPLMTAWPPTFPVLNDGPNQDE
ncbi:hypothetical protein HU200_015518 [Digitaria exilis]|uniref:F-box protein AT5G49610-like beta-propeller domain-containing protein n=1 Tax=Digitaria exilis TaxID=1010633 RepID=A0A835FAF9_9POAL|nr:hypothetical protein HU200_015518 [Digitaria exilis]